MTRPRRLRQADEWVGLLVLLTVALFLAAALQAGVLRDWLRPMATLHVLLPESGVGGLSVGAEMEVLGTRAGTVRRVVIEPDQRMYAEVQVEDQARVFIRRDSVAVIRKRFGVAGAAYLDVSRGSGPPLDWEFAVIEATTERAPTETMGALVDDLANRVFPILADAQRGIASLANVIEGIERGDGSVGRLLRDDSLARSAEGIARSAEGAARSAEAIGAEVQAAAAQLGPVIAALARIAAETQSLVASLGPGAPNGGPVRRVDAILADVQRMSRDLSRTTARLPQTARNAEETTANLPALLLQTQQTTRELEALLTQLRGMWLLGGSGAPPPAPMRPPSERLRP